MPNRINRDGDLETIPGTGHWLEVTEYCRVGGYLHRELRIYFDAYAAPEKAYRFGGLFRDTLDQMTFEEANQDETDFAAGTAEDAYRWLLDMEARCAQDMGLAPDDSDPSVQIEELAVFQHAVQDSDGTPSGIQRLYEEALEPVNLSAFRKAQEATSTVYAKEAA